ncbi:MAG: DMT family transporter [Kiloniellales bacterium]
MTSIPPQPSAATALAGASGNLRGMLMMALATIVLASMHSMVRHVGAEVHPFEIAFFRNLFGLLVMLPWLIRAGPASLASRQPGMQALRGAVVLIAMLSWFYGLSVVPIAQATALSFTAAIFGSLGAVLFLGERMRLRRWTAVLIGFAGVLVILRPGLGAVDTGSLIVLLAAVSWGASLVIIKVLARTDSSVTIVAWVTIVLSVLSLPPALVVWAWPTPTQLMWLMLIGALGSAGHLAMTQALKLSDETTAVIPVDFMRLIWTSLIGYLAFAEVPDFWVWIGGSTIFASTLYIAYREAKVTGVAPTPDKTQILG